MNNKYKMANGFKDDAIDVTSDDTINALATSRK